MSLSGLTAICGLACSILQAQTSSVSGRLIDSQTGAPVAGARVSAIRSGRSGPAGWSLPDGSFQLSGLPTGAKLTLAVNQFGYVDPSGEQPETFEIPPGGNKQLGEVKLARGAVLSGTVLDPWGEPAEAATLRLSRKYQAEAASAIYLPVAVAATDDRGRYTFYDVAPGWYRLTASSPEAYLQQTAVPEGPPAWREERFHEVAFNTELPVGSGVHLTGLDLQLGLAINASEPPKATGDHHIELKAADCVSKQPILRAAVRLRSPQGTVFTTATDDYGTVSLAGLAAGDYEVTVSKRGYAPAVAHVTATAQAGAAVIIELVAGAVITGAVRPRDGRFRDPAVLDLLERPAAGGEWKPRTTVLPDRSGHFRIAELPEGQYQLLSRKTETLVSDFGGARPRARDSGGDGDPLTFSTRSGEERALRDLAIGGFPLYRVAGMIHERGSRLPLTGLRIYLGATRSPDGKPPVFVGDISSDGHFAFDGLRGGSYSIVASRPAPAHEAWRFDLEVRDRDIEDLDLAPDPAFKLTANVICPGIKPARLKGIRVNLLRDLGFDWMPPGSRQGITFHADPSPAAGDGGALTFWKIPPGRYQIDMRLPDGLSLDDVQQEGKTILRGRTVEIAGKAPLLIKLKRR